MADYYAWDVVYGDLPDASEYRENPLIAVENQIQRYNSTRKEQKDFTENLYKAYKDYLLKGNESTLLGDAYLYTPRRVERTGRIYLLF